MRLGRPGTYSGCQSIQRRPGRQSRSSPPWSARHALAFSPDGTHRRCRPQVALDLDVQLQSLHADSWKKTTRHRIASLFRPTDARWRLGATMVRSSSGTCPAATNGPFCEATVLPYGASLFQPTHPACCQPVKIDRSCSGTRFEGIAIGPLELGREGEQSGALCRLRRRWPACGGGRGFVKSLGHYLDRFRDGGNPQSPERAHHRDPCAGLFPRWPHSGHGRPGPLIKLWDWADGRY